MANEGKIFELPLLPLPRGLVVFPGQLQPLAAVEESDVKLINDVLSQGQDFGAFCR